MKSTQRVPADRIRLLNDAPVRADGEYVVYWMTVNRRASWNDSLDRAAELARELGKPLMIFEALRAGYRWANERFHRFVLDGMADNQRAFEGTGVLYHPYVEPTVGAGSGALEHLARKACALVTDDYPAFFLPRMARAVADRIDVRLEAVDSNGIFPLHGTDREFARAYDFRRFLQRELRPHLGRAPRRELQLADLKPLKRLPADFEQRWPRAAARLLDAEGRDGGLSELPIDHQVPPAPSRGGSSAATRCLRDFLGERSARYGQDRNQPEADGSSGLSPYLHFGQISAHQVFHELVDAEGWSPARLSESTSGKREGWWGASAATEAFLDQLITWRELGFQFCAKRPDYDRFDSLPDWARRSLEEHAQDRRPHVYTLEQFENANTHDELWNAAQNQLRIEGRMHNYLRMLWGKKILHWSESPRAALEIMIELNNKYALDGRDPNSYSGIFWTLGRFDRAWGPEREVFGKIRYMSSANTRRKLRVNEYIERWSEWQLAFPD
jgi:deoxyribodipyrimidine photo-lyase